MLDYKKEIVKLKQACYSCKECPLGDRLVDGRDPHVFANGKVPADIMCIAEAPGADEVRQGIPLCGRSGQFYNEKILAPAGLKRNQVYTSNAVHCRPANNRTPFAAEVNICRQHLDAEICLIEPKLIISMGNIGLYGSCEMFGIGGITKHRGGLRLSRQWSKGTRIPVLPLFHPAYCLRGSGLKEMAKDVELLGKLVHKIKIGEKLEV